MSDDNRILVLGVGNILYTDEGVGVRCVEWLQERYEFPEHVQLVDGGTLGMRLMDFIMNTDYLIVVDAVLGGDEPGSIYRFTGDDLRKSIAFKDSLHQTDLVDTLIYCELLGNRPEAVIIGIEPTDYETMATEVSETSAKRLPLMAGQVLKEIEQAGGSYRPKHATAKE
jgi:hydrogenase maturation protease